MNIYVHLPFCVRKCLYCDFYSVGVRNFPMSRYVDALIAEFNAHADAHAPEDYTLYIGGGTPSLLPAVHLQRLAEAIMEKKGPPMEFTLEVNPDDVTPERAQEWHRAGVDRISMGIQSLENEELEIIGRRHDAATAVRAYEILAEYFDNISLDMMFGLPLQTQESLRRTINKFMAIRPAHISAYSLMYEERTALTQMRDRGRVKESDDDDCVAMFRMICSALAAAGYEQYEISNYALPGKESQHNSAYWTGTPYLGIGAGAHSYDGIRTRTRNLEDYKKYIDYWTAAELHDAATAGIVDMEYLDDEELAEEMIMTRLRTRKGLNVREYGKRFGVRMGMALVNRARPHISAGNLRVEDGNLILTREGIMIADTIIASLF